MRRQRAGDQTDRVGEARAEALAEIAQPDGQRDPVDPELLRLHLVADVNAAGRLGVLAHPRGLQHHLVERVVFAAGLCLDRLARHRIDRGADLRLDRGARRLEPPRHDVHLAEFGRRAGRNGSEGQIGGNALPAPHGDRSAGRGKPALHARDRVIARGDAGEPVAAVGPAPCHLGDPARRIAQAELHPRQRPALGVLGLALDRARRCRGHRREGAAEQQEETQKGDDVAPPDCRRDHAAPRCGRRRLRRRPEGGMIARAAAAVTLLSDKR